MWEAVTVLVKLSAPAGVLMATESARPAGPHPVTYATTLGTWHQHNMSSSLAVTTSGAPGDQASQYRRSVKLSC